MRLLKRNLYNNRIVIGQHIILLVILNLILNINAAEVGQPAPREIVPSPPGPDMGCSHCQSF